MVNMKIIILGMNSMEQFSANFEGSYNNLKPRQGSIKSNIKLSTDNVELLLTHLTWEYIYIYSHSSVKVKYNDVIYDSELFGVSKRSITHKMRKLKHNILMINNVNGIPQIGKCEKIRKKSKRNNLQISGMGMWSFTACELTIKELPY